MFSFAKLIGKTSQPSRTTAHRPARARLQFEQLECRQLMSVSPNFGYVMPNAQVMAIYYGPSWSSNPGLVQQLDGFFQNITNSAYMDMLGEYGVGRGSFRGHEINSDGPASGSVYDVQLQNMLSSQWKLIVPSDPHQTGDFDFLPSTPTHLYFIFTDPNVVVTGPNGVPGNSPTNGFYGYHSDIAALFSDTYYAVIPYPTSGLNPVISGLSAFQQMTEVASHELAEAVTNPTGYGGCWDSNPSSPTYKQEIGDIANLQYGDLNGYKVQYEYSNNANAPILWTDQAHWVRMGDGWVSKTVSAMNSDGRQELFGIGGDHAAYHKWQMWANGPWTDWAYMGGYITDIAVGQNANGLLEVFGIGGDAAVWTKTQNARLDWGPDWVSLGGYCRSVAVETGVDARIQVFVIGGDYGVWRNSQIVPNADPHTGWTGWNSLGGSVQSITVGKEQDGLVEVFAVWSDGTVRTSLQGLDSTYTYWINFNTPNYGVAATSIVVGTNADGRQELFAIGTDGAVYHCWEAGSNAYGNWAGWGNLGGYVKSLAVGRKADGRLEVFGVGGNDAVYEITEVYGSLDWNQAWVELGAYAQAITAGQNADGSIELFVIGNDNGVNTTTLY